MRIRSSGGEGVLVKGANFSYFFLKMAPEKIIKGKYNIKQKLKFKDITKTILTLVNSFIFILKIQ